MVIIKTVDLFFQFIYFLVLLRVILSWIPIGNNSITKFIYHVTDPILEPFRLMLSRFMPRGGGFYIDFSPVIALLVLNIIRQVVLNILLKIII